MNKSETSVINNYQVLYISHVCLSKQIPAVLQIENFRVKKYFKVACWDPTLHNSTTLSSEDLISLQSVMKTAWFSHSLKSSRESVQIQSCLLLPSTLRHHTPTSDSFFYYLSINLQIYQPILLCSNPKLICRIITKRGNLFSYSNNPLNHTPRYVNHPLLTSGKYLQFYAKSKANFY